MAYLHACNAMHWKCAREWLWGTTRSYTTGAACQPACLPTSPLEIRPASARARPPPAPARSTLHRMSSVDEDTFNLRRFTKKQNDDGYHDTAIRELTSGQKASCWSWWIFPTPPFIRNGKRVGSGLNLVYEIKDDSEGKAYLNFENLRANYLLILNATHQSLVKGITPRKLLGIDVPRAIASARYFLRLGRDSGDEELVASCLSCLELLDPPSPSQKRPREEPPAKSTLVSRHDEQERAEQK